MKATAIVHWPGKDTAACDRHRLQLQGLASHLGFQLSETPCDPELDCTNCQKDNGALVTVALISSFSYDLS
jgi:hypothetical protein